MPALGLTAYGVAVLVLTGTLAVADARTRLVRRVYWLPLAALGLYNATDTTLLLLAIALASSLAIGLAFYLSGAGFADWLALAVLPLVVPTSWPIVLAGGVLTALALVWLEVYDAGDVPFLAALWPPLALSVIFLP